MSKNKNTLFKAIIIIFVLLYIPIIILKFLGHTAVVLVLFGIQFIIVIGMMSYIIVLFYKQLQEYDWR